MELLLAAGYIFILRLIDQSLGTLRTLYVNKGKPLFGALLGFIESGIWIIAISQVIRDLNDPFLAIGYALGFAAGTIVGSYIESSIAIGDVVVRIFSPKDADSQKVATELRNNGFLNIHASILPKYRGAAPIQRAIMSQDIETGISFMKINEHLDTVLFLKLIKLKLTQI